MPGLLRQRCHFLTGKLSLTQKTKPSDALGRRFVVFRCPTRHSTKEVYETVPNTPSVQPDALYESWIH